MGGMTPDKKKHDHSAVQFALALSSAADEVLHSNLWTPAEQVSVASHQRRQLRPEGPAPSGCFA